MARAGCASCTGPNGKNVRLAVLLRQLGFQHVDGEFQQSLEGELPPYPDWLRIE